MSSSDSSDVASFPFPLQIEYDGPADRLRVAVDVDPAPLEDVRVEVGSRRLRIAVDRDDGTAERTLTPLPTGLVVGDDCEAVYNNGVLSVSLETVPRGQ
ncbi:Hsp20/alpha crystallin family protein [Natrinema salinisoli]|uniref:Hsp20/alpha crystallin family protein n=1 Tax=Natrinema salinisoli TaxID=2878535 RepID=UPI001CF02C9A|nr:Hsp20/alpha crystallin family protein [Natrinema salinisoli]